MKDILGFKKSYFRPFLSKIRKKTSSMSWATVCGSQYVKYIRNIMFWHPKHILNTFQKNFENMFFNLENSFFGHQFHPIFGMIWWKKADLETSKACKIFSRCVRPIVWVCFTRPRIRAIQRTLNQVHTTRTDKNFPNKLDMCEKTHAETAFHSDFSK